MKDSVLCKWKSNISKRLRYVTVWLMRKSIQTIWTLIKESVNSWLVKFGPVAFELSPHQIMNIFFNVFHQSLAILGDNHFWIEGTSKISPWIESCSSSLGSIVSPEGMKYYLDVKWTAHLMLLRYANSCWTISSGLCFSSFHESISFKSVLKILL